MRTKNKHPLREFNSWVEWSSIDKYKRTSGEIDALYHRHAYWHIGHHVSFYDCKIKSLKQIIVNVLDKV